MVLNAAKLAMAHAPVLARYEGDRHDGARCRLSDHLDALNAQREVAKQHQFQWRRLKLIEQAEAEARARLDAIRAQDVKELADQLANPTGFHSTVDHDAVAGAERDLARATREAEVARGCEADTSARLTDSTRALSALEQRTPLLIAEVLIEEAEVIAAEAAAEAAQLRAKHARLQALRRFIDDSKLPPQLLGRVPSAPHPDNIFPEFDEVRREADAWRRLADRLAADPAADLQE